VTAYQNARECLEAAVVRDDLAIALVDLQLAISLVKQGVLVCVCMCAGVCEWAHVGGGLRACV
jgi:hypothetical protein